MKIHMTVLAVAGLLVFFFNAGFLTDAHTPRSETLVVSDCQKPVFQQDEVALVLPTHVSLRYVHTGKKMDSKPHLPRGFVFPGSLCFCNPFQFKD